MIIDIKSNGWDEITRVKIRISQILKNFNTNEDWIKFHTDERQGMRLYKNRKSCKCCGSKWEDSGSNIHLAFTDKGNKIICDDCLELFEANGVKINEQVDK